MNAFAVLLLALSSPSLSGTAALDQSETYSPCRARAWVRAPDLEPGQVVQGDVRVKLDGTCDDVSSYSLGLRFAERSWVKTRREGVNLPERPTGFHWPSFLPRTSNDSVYEQGLDWMFPSDATLNQSVWEKYENNMKNSALWLVREEERIGFEAKYIIRNAAQGSRNMVEPFAILVPSTNYPPGIDMSMGMGISDEADFADSEQIYAYFVDVHFKNGTHEEISAGYTSFNAVIKYEPPAPETVNVTATRSHLCNNDLGCDTSDAAYRDEFTLEVTFPSGRHFEQGSSSNVTIISHQLGPGLQRALDVQNRGAYAMQRHRWAAKFAVDNKTAEKLLDAGFMHSDQRQLSPEPDDEFHENRFLETRKKLTPFAQDGVVRNGTNFTTEAITLSFGVTRQCYPTFDMYYDTAEVELVLKLQVRNLSSKDAAQPETIGEDDDYNWTPWLRGTEEDSWGEFLTARIPIFVHRRPEDRSAPNPHDVIHYLSPGARAPIFVDPLSVVGLRRMTKEDRDNLAPVAQPKFDEHADADVVKHRYYKKGAWRGMRISPLIEEGPHYVGDTWLRKVLRGESRAEALQDDTLVVQA